jgi:peptidoglycan hydrolase CwlO-like protein
MDMAGRFEDIIQKQEALIAALEEQHAADQKLIHLQEQQIQALQEKTVLLEKEKQALADAGNDMAAACGRLEKICGQQQELLEAFHRALPEP